MEKYAKTSSTIKEGWSEACVDELIDVESGKWNEDTLHEFLEHSEVERIIRTPLSSHGTKDKMIWRFTKKFCFR